MFSTPDYNLLCPGTIMSNTFLEARGFSFENYLFIIHPCSRVVLLQGFPNT